MNMNRIQQWILGVAVLFATAGAQGAAGVDIIVHEGVSAASVTDSALKDILTGKTMYWEGGQAVIIVLPGDKADAAIQEVSGMNAGQFKTHWQRIGFSGRGQPPKRVDDVEKAIALVTSTKGAIALVPSGTDAKGVKKLESK